MKDSILQPGKFPHEKAAHTSVEMTQKKAFPVREKTSLDITKKLHRILQKRLVQYADQD